MASVLPACFRSDAALFIEISSWVIAQHAGPFSSALALRQHFADMQMSSESKSKIKGFGGFCAWKHKEDSVFVELVLSKSLSLSLSLLSQLEESGMVLKNLPNDQSGHQAEKQDEWKKGDQLSGNVKELNGRWNSLQPRGVSLHRVQFRQLERMIALSLPHFHIDNTPARGSAQACIGPVNAPWVPCMTQTALKGEKEGRPFD